MKANKFLIALALCVGFSSSITITSQTPPPSWTQSIKNRLSDWWNGTQKNVSYAGAKLTEAKNYTLKVSQQLMNRISQWSVQAQIAVFTGVVMSLAAFYNIDELTKMLKGAFEQASPYAEKAAEIASRGVNYATENPKAAAAIVTVPVIIGGKAIYNRQTSNSLDAKLLKNKFNQQSIDAAFQEAINNDSISTLKAVLRNRYTNPKTSNEIRSNIKYALENNWQTTQNQSVGALKQQFVKDFIGTQVNLEGANEE